MDNFGGVGLSMLGTFLSAANLTGDVLIADVNGGRSPNDAWWLLLNLGRSASELKGLESILDSGLFSFSLQRFKKQELVRIWIPNIQIT